MVLWVRKLSSNMVRLQICFLYFNEIQPWKLTWNLTMLLKKDKPPNFRGVFIHRKGAHHWERSPHPRVYWICDRSRLKPRASQRTWVFITWEYLTWSKTHTNNYNSDVCWNLWQWSLVLTTLRSSPESIKCSGNPYCCAVMLHTQFFTPKTPHIQICQLMGHPDCIALTEKWKKSLVA